MSGVRDLRFTVKNYLENNVIIEQHFGLANECLIETIKNKDYIANLVSYRRKISLEKKAIQQKNKIESALKKIDYENYKENISVSNIEKNKFLNLMYEKLDFKLFNIGEDQINRIKELEYEKQVELIQNLYSFSIDYSRMKEFIYLSEKEGKKLHISNELNDLVDKIKETIRNNDFVLLNLLVGKIKKIIELSINYSKDYEYDISSLNQMNDIIYKMENEIGNSIGETLDVASVEKDNELKRIVELENETFKICSDIANLDYIESEIEIRELKHSIFSMIVREDFPIEDKISFIEKRIGFLRDKYLKFCSIIGNSLDLKRIYDKKYNTLLKYCESLNLEYPNYDFDYKNPDTSIKNIEKKIAIYKYKFEEKEKANYVRKIIWDTMLEQNKVHILSKKVGKGNNLIQDFFYNGDGTVTIITFFPSGRVTERVAGVKLDGISENKKLIVEGMTKECENHKKTLNKYKNQGIEVEILEIIEPDIDNAIEIELDGSVSTEIIEKIRNVKLNQITYEEKKVRYNQ